jgi:hypothetical protein
MVTAKKRRGRPSRGLSEDRVYLRLTKELGSKLRDLCAKQQQATGYPVSLADVVRKILTDALLEQP